MSYTPQPIMYTKLESHLSTHYPCHVSNSAVIALIKMGFVQQTGRIFWDRRGHFKTKTTHAILYQHN